MDLITEIDDSVFIGSEKHPLNLTENFKSKDIHVIINCSNSVSYLSDEFKVFDINNYISDTSFLNAVNKALNENKYIVINYPLEINCKSIMISNDDQTEIEPIDDLISKLKILDDLNLNLYFHCDQSYSRSCGILIYFLMISRTMLFRIAYGSVLSIENIEVNEDIINELRNFSDMNTV